jgi:hypothetical protein
MLLGSSACNPDGPAGSGLQSGSSTTGTDASTSNSTTDLTDGSSGGATPTTGADSSTGEPGYCAPSEGPISADEFASRFAETLCAQKEACGCEVDFGCAGVLSQSFQTIADFAAEHGLAFDGECAAHMLSVTVATRGCAPRSRYFDAPALCWNRCTPFQGDVPSGGACEGMKEGLLSPYVDSCAGEESCQYEGSCGIYEPELLQEGDVCFSPMSGLLGRCEDGTGCNYDTTKCVKLMPEGESCADGLLCDYSTWCNPQFVCQARLEAGEPCTDFRQCNSLRCSDGACSDTIFVCEVDEAHDLWSIPIP